METDYEGILFSFWLQIFWYQDIDADRVLIDDFVAGAVDVKRRELLRIHGCGLHGHLGRRQNLWTMRLLESYEG